LKAGRIVVEVSVRAVFAVLLWEQLTHLYNLARGFSLPSFAAVEPLLQFALTSASAIAAGIAVAAANLTLLVVSAIILVVAKGFAGASLEPPTLLALSAAFIGDTVRSLYREGEEKYVRTPPRSFAVALLAASSILVIFVALASLASRFAGALEAVPRSTSDFVKLVVENPLYRIGIAAAIAAALYKAITTAFDVVSGFLYPSRQSALSALLDEKSLDIFFSPPLSTIKWIAVSSVVSPLVYAAVYRLPLENLVKSLVRPGVEEVLSVAVGVAIFIAVTWALVRIERGLTFSPEAAVKGSAAILIILYAAAVYASLKSGETLLNSVLRPDFGSIAAAAADIYRGYYAAFFRFVDMLSRLLGVAP